MAKLSHDGLEELSLSFQEIAELPENVADAMLEAEADIVMEAQRNEAQKLGMYAGYPSTNGNQRDTSPTNSLPGQTHDYSTGGLARALKKAKPKTGKGGGRSLSLYFAGSRKRGNTVTKNSEIAYLNEFGSRNINARNFIWTANEKAASKAVDAAANVHDNYLKSKNL